MGYDVVVIGAGQAGLAIGYFLQKSGLSFVILDQGKEIGEVWKNRYDSLKLFTPRDYSALPGLKLNDGQEEYPTKADIANYLVDYADTFKLPIELETKVDKLSKKGETFIVSTNKGELHTDQVIIATGPFQQPFIPDFSSRLPKNIFQTHSSQYKNSFQLNEGSVLVVGGGNSGAQIAVELASEGRKVYLSVSHKMTFLPLQIGQKSIFWWFDKVGLYKASVHSKVGQFVQSSPDPIFGFELKRLINNKTITLLKRTNGIKGNHFLFEDGNEIHVENVIWSTGFQSNYSWIDIPDVINSKGTPNHEKGITSVKGLYFIGLAWQVNRSSALLQGVGNDAAFIYEEVEKNKTKSIMKMSV